MFKHAHNRLQIARECLLTILVLAISSARSSAVDTTYLPKLSRSEKSAIVQVWDMVENTTGTGFVIGHDRQQRTLVLTNEHTVDSGQVWVKLHDEKTVRRVDVLATCSVRDLALLRLHTKRPLPSLSLAPRTYSIAKETPVLAVGASYPRLLLHTGTFDDASQFNHESANAVYESIYAHTPSGFSGGPVLAIDKNTLSPVVIGVTAKATATKSFGPWISEIHDFLGEQRSVTGPIAFGESRTPKPYLNQPAEDDDLFSEIFEEKPPFSESPIVPESYAGRPSMVTHKLAMFLPIRRSCTASEESLFTGAPNPYLVVLAELSCWPEIAPRRSLPFAVITIDTVTSTLLTQHKCILNNIYSHHIK